jgi:hypothetical protein
MDESAFMKRLKNTVEKHGCTFIDVDIENHYINLDGPDAAIAECVKAISELAEGRPDITTVH